MFMCVFILAQEGVYCEKDTFTKLVKGQQTRLAVNTALQRHQEI